MSNSVYDFYYVYNDGSFYYGTVSSNNSYGYYTGEKINESNGYYYIYANGGTTNDAAGTVHTSDYYDSTSGKSYTPYYYSLGYADGSSGLGSEYDYTNGAKGYQEYGGGGKYEAKQGSNTLFDYEYIYKDGSFYYGTVSSDYYHGNYYTGETISGSNGGYYYIYANAGNTSQTSGTVHTTAYYDSTSSKYYTPYDTGLGSADGSSGLGSEYDWTYGAKGYQEFGGSGKYEAKQGSSTLFDYEYIYKDGSYYYGTVSSDYSHGNYYTGETISGSNGGYYYIYANAGNTSQTAGTVHTTAYYDSTSGKSYTPYDTGLGSADGSSGLGSEYDWTYGAKGYQEFGGSGKYEAKQGSSTLFDYEYIYSDGSYYYGTVSSDYYHGNYYAGETISGSNGGYYYVYANAGNTSQTSGTVHTTSYFDSTSGKSYTPYYTGLGYADGSSGLGSEYDYTYGAKGYQLFGESGKWEAKQA